MLLLFIISTLIFASTSSATEIGNTCQLLNNGTGVCTLLANCSSAINDLEKNVLPKICGFKGTEPIVCCSKANDDKSKSERISKRKCVEYGKSVFTEEKLLLTDQVVNMSRCGIENNFLIDTIFARPKMFPHMALIGNGNETDTEWYCSGSLISEKYILTVAHCTYHRISGMVNKVRLGDLDFKSTRDAAMFEEYRIVQSILHPQYRPPVFYNDIALLELDRPVTFNEFVRPACLYSGNDDVNHFILTGWGLATNEEENRGHLRKTSRLSKISYEQCNNVYKNLGNRRLKDGILPEKMICTEESDDDSCFITSGGALQKYNTDVHCMYDIVGVLSFGTGFCSKQPIVHTKVSGYIDWIESIVWPEAMKI